MENKIKVPYLDLIQQFADTNLRREILRVFDNCNFVLGSLVSTFEKYFANLCGTRFAVGVNSGTDAIFLSLKAANIGKGHEVITVANSFIATAGAIIAAGAKPVFVDVGSDYNMDPSAIEKALSPQTKAILPVHLTGCPASMDSIMKVANERGLFVIEDAAQSVGASIDKRKVGSFGHVGCFSLHPLKNLNVAGDGGIITTDDEKIYSRLKQIRNHGLVNRDEIETFGYNSRLDTLHAVIGLYNLEKLEQVTQIRINNAKRYDHNLSDLSPNLTLPPRSENIRQVYHTYVVQVEKREELVDKLYRAGIETKIHYPIPIHFQKPCRELGWKKGDLPVTEEQAKMILSLPIHQFLTNEQIDYVIENIIDFYNGR